MLLSNRATKIISTYGSSQVPKYEMKEPHILANLLNSKKLDCSLKLIESRKRFLFFLIKENHILILLKAKSNQRKINSSSSARMESAELC
jgi:hypothetical protein